MIAQLRHSFYILRKNIFFYLFNFYRMGDTWHQPQMPLQSICFVMHLCSSMNSLPLSSNIIFHTGKLKVKSICMQPGKLNVRDHGGGQNKDGEWEDDRNAFTTTNSTHSKCQPSHSLLPLLFIYFISCHRLVCPSDFLTKWNMFLLSRCLMRQLS